MVTDKLVRCRPGDPAIGRWISQDPLGFDAGDANLYRYVRNAPTLKTDPDGLKELVVIGDPQPKNVYFDEEVLESLQHINSKDKTLNGFAKDAADFKFNIQELKDIEGVTMKVHYGDFTVSAFAADAKKNGPCTVNLYFGHGPPVLLPAVHTEPLNGALSAFIEVLASRAAMNVKCELGGQMEMENASQAPLYNLYSCYATYYNAMINPANRLTLPFEAVKSILVTQAVSQFNRNFESLEKDVKKLAKACGEKGLTIHLYFSQVRTRKGDDLKEAEKDPKKYLIGSYLR
jgi:hypothetical protein